MKGGSYKKNPETGELKLIQRTEPAKPEQPEAETKPAPKEAKR